MKTPEEILKEVYENHPMNYRRKCKYYSASGLKNTWESVVIDAMKKYADQEKQLTLKK